MGRANRLNRTEIPGVSVFVIESSTQPNLYMMNPLRSTFAAFAVGGLLFSAASAALAGPKDYQFTGPIVSMNDTTLVVQKGKENWEFAKDASTKLPEGAKVGDKITVHYVMHAESVEASVRAKNPPKDKAKKSADTAPAADTTPAAAASPKP